MRKWLFSLLLLATSCGSPSSEKYEPFARLNLASEPPSLDPRQATDATSGKVLGMLFEGLTRVDATGVARPAMAKEIDLSDDGLVYTFHLRKSGWSNASTVTAYDFEQTWRDILTPTFPADYAYYLYVIKGGKAAKEGKASLDEIGIRAIDAQTLEVTLEQPTPYFLELTASHNYFPVNREVAAANPNWANEGGESYVGNGPFRLVEWAHSDEMVLERNPYYWEAEQVKLEGILISMIEDPATELHMFENGELDWAGHPLSIGLPTDALPALKEAGILHSDPGASVYYYTLNTKRYPLNNANIRKALAYAINRRAIVENITQAGQQPALGYVPPTMPFEQKPFFHDHDVKRAKELFAKGLEELGTTVDKLPSIELAFNMGEAHLKVAQAVQQQWSAVLGVRTELVGSEWKVYLDTLHHHDYMIGRLGWVADFNDPMSFLEVFKEEGSSNHPQWTNAQYTALLNRANTIRDPERRHDVLLKAEEILMDEMPIVPVYFHTEVYVRSDRLKNVVLTPLGQLDLKWSYIE